jgi:hypothetical protein
MKIMKYFLLTLICCALTFIAKSQNASVEKSTSGFQIGVLGTWFYNEAKLSNKISLRSELGLDSGIFGIMHSYEVGYILIPDITVEPRYYYNLNKRVTKSKSIAGNSGNFVSLRTSYYPDWFVVTKNENLRPYHHIAIIPSWGIKRNVGNHFTYEAGLGIGYRYYFTKRVGFPENQLNRSGNLHIRIGYRF